MGSIVDLVNEKSAVAQILDHAMKTKTLFEAKSLDLAVPSPRASELHKCGEEMARIIKGGETILEIVNRRPG